MLLPKQLGWQRATHKHQYPAWTSCVPASSSGCAAGTRQDLLTGLARALQALLKPNAPEWKRLPLCNASSSGQLVSTGACSVAASYKPPMLVTRAQLPACACGAPLAGTHMRVRVYGSSAASSAGRWQWWQCCCCLNSWAGNTPHISISTLPGPSACPHHHRAVQLAHDRTCSQDLPGHCRHS